MLMGLRPLGMISIGDGVTSNMIPSMAQDNIANHCSAYSKLPSKYRISSVETNKWGTLSNLFYHFFRQPRASILRSIFNWWDRLIKSPLLYSVPNVFTLCTRKQVTGVIASTPVARMTGIHARWQFSFVKEVVAKAVYAYLCSLPNNFNVFVWKPRLPEDTIHGEFIERQRCKLHQIIDALLIFFSRTAMSCSCRIKAQRFGSPKAGAWGRSCLQQNCPMEMLS
jgi:hypothetical protein